MFHNLHIAKIFVLIKYAQNKCERATAAETVGWLVCKFHKSPLLKTLPLLLLLLMMMSCLL